ncbi:VRR-NUC domain-containing protein [Acinetobacter colistiniresistens]|uniref:VRR-NUC domain-containing protein n=1 Tax=Acinetobacter colistiniresistens TaxID=280145 RepID=UPI0012505E85|nr:VRR-NUC domain-containing protein [Acinetobacter colistiniresistens]
MTRFKTKIKALDLRDPVLTKTGPKRKRIYDRTERSALGLPPLEDDLQMDVMLECDYIKYKNNPVSKYLHHSPNGGYRGKQEAVRFKKMGTKKGFPDLFLFISNGVFKGLFIEMKSGTNTTTPEQKEMHRLLNEEGYKVVVCYTVQGAINAIKDYLNIKIK